MYIIIGHHDKHQWHVVEVIARLRKTTGWSLTLDLIGPAYPKALKRLQNSLQRFDPEGNWVRYHGPIPFADLHRMYARAEIGIFALSCENMPNILLEIMAAGLPIACSNFMPMPEILGEAGVYFDPENPKEIASALRQLITSHELRTELAHASFSASSNYTWERCAGQTFAFLFKVHQNYMKQENTCVA